MKTSFSTKSRSTRARAVGAGAALLAIAAVGAYIGARAQNAAPGRFASAMPQGALVYVEARDLEGLLQTWLSSPVRERYYASASYRSFQRSRLYAKIRARLESFESGFGVAVDDEQLAKIAGGPSAIAIYEPGRLEVLLATEAASEQAASALLANASSFDRRQTAKGAPFYSREVTAGEGEAPQRIAFGLASGVLWVGTNEAIVAEAIDGAAGGGLGSSVNATLAAAGDVEMHDLLVWFDMERSLKNKYFDLYWIHRNPGELEGLSSGLLDVAFGPDGIVERRWYVRKEPAQVAASPASSLEALASLAPADAQLVEVKAADVGVSTAIAETVFGPEREPAALEAVTPSYSGDDSDDGDRPARAPRRYAYLDDRFDRDVDDPSQALADRARPASMSPARAPFAERVAAIASAAAPVRYAIFGSVKLPDGQLFASFERTVVVELGAPERFDRAAFESLVAEEFGTRFIVGSEARNVAWADAAGARTIRGALIAQGGAYRLAGRYLVVSRDAASCDAVASRLGAMAESAPKAGSDGASLVRLAEVRVAAGRPAFARLTSVLDAKERSTVNESIGDGGEGSSRPVLFFSENLTSLLDTVRELERVRITTGGDAKVLRERVEYLWAPAPRAEAAPAQEGGTPPSEPSVPSVPAR